MPLCLLIHSTNTPLPGITGAPSEGGWPGVDRPCWPWGPGLPLGSFPLPLRPEAPCLRPPAPRNHPGFLSVLSGSSHCSAGRGPAAGCEEPRPEPPLLALVLAQLEGSPRHRDDAFTGGHTQLNANALAERAAGPARPSAGGSGRRAVAATLPVCAFKNAVRGRETTAQAPTGKAGRAWPKARLGARKAGVGQRPAGPSPLSASPRPPSHSRPPRRPQGFPGPPSAGISCTRGLSQARSSHPTPDHDTLRTAHRFPGWREEPMQSLAQTRRPAVPHWTGCQVSPVEALPLNPADPE